MIRRAAVAGRWYPGTADVLRSEVDRHLGGATREVAGDLVALVAPHAGLMYSGPVAAHAYTLLRGRPFDLVVLVGPSHFVGFDGVAVFPGEGFASPLGIAPVDEDAAAALVRTAPVVHADAAPHGREHSLEMQLPFVQRLAPDTPILPLLMGYQTGETARALADGLTRVLQGRRTLLVASSDLSHYHDARTAAALDAIVIEHVRRFDPDGLQRALDVRPEHACGGGPMVAVMRAARALGACDALALHYADSGDVSGDKGAVVGYLAAAFGNFRERGHSLGKDDDQH
ncbi:MAG: AmmeMemoRadiSam system protein B [Betaproteobacteria bacterium]